MNLILDTHILLWAWSDPGRIRKDQLAAIETRANVAWVSSISIAEMVIKASIGKLKLDFDPVAAARDSGFSLLDFSGADALLLRDLPFHHRDPFDRMLIAQSMANRYAVVTDDRRFVAYGCRVV